MSLWRAKRRYDSHRHFEEKADEALLAIALLRSRSEGNEATPYTPEQIKAFLDKGIDLLEEIEEALSNPSSVDDEQYALSEKLAERWTVISSDAIDKLNAQIQVLERTKAELTVSSELDDVETTFRIVENISSQTSKTEAENLRMGSVR